MADPLGWLLSARQVADLADPLGWLLSARQVADLADPMLPAAQAHARGTVLPASQPNKQLDSCIVQCYI